MPNNTREQSEPTKSYSPKTQGGFGSPSSLAQQMVNVSSTNGFTCKVLIELTGGLIADLLTAFMQLTETYRSHHTCSWVVSLNECIYGN